MFIHACPCLSLYAHVYPDRYILVDPYVHETLVYIFVQYASIYFVVYLDISCAFLTLFYLLFNLDKEDRMKMLDQDKSKSCTNLFQMCKCSLYNCFYEEEEKRRVHDYR